MFSLKRCFSINVLLIALFAVVFALSHQMPLVKGKEVQVRHTRDAIHITINVGDSSSSDEKQQVDSTTQSIVSKFKQVIGKEEEKQLSEKFLRLASRVKAVS